MIKTKSVYEPPEPTDGKRVLVMTIWPRGVRKDRVDEWQKDLGTPKELIHRWKGGKVTWAVFTSQYKKSLNGKEAQLRRLAEEGRKGDVTLLCTEKDAAHCHRSILKEVIERMA